MYQKVQVQNIACNYIINNKQVLWHLQLLFFRYSFDQAAKIKLMRGMYYRKGQMTECPTPTPRKMGVTVLNTFSARLSSKKSRRLLNDTSYLQMNLIFYDSFGLFFNITRKYGRAGVFSTQFYKKRCNRGFCFDVKMSYQFPDELLRTILSKAIFVLKCMPTTSQDSVG